MRRKDGNAIRTWEAIRSNRNSKNFHIKLQIPHKSTMAADIPRADYTSMRKRKAGHDVLMEIWYTSMPDKKD
ncbi:hypothetical protein WA026_006912 [Henosepilachna vigintioctopunctata]|uniref:Uncharacterized protein n=1 Tax=Henosepilachna vigintioctopunctata TaxID=420089 RepID=A0AAW1V1I4_9CUCU